MPLRISRRRRLCIKDRALRALSTGNREIIHKMRLHRAVLIAILTGALCSTVILIYASLRSDGGQASVELPTACDNFVEAAKAFASHGSSSGLSGAPVVFHADAANRPANMLESLLNACDEQLAARAP
jgi:hypothetical protein